MRVFVLSTGRCGSTTFANACGHLTNFSATHESRASGLLFEDRFSYPDNHIEVDNPLSWFLGDLGHRFDQTDCLYVHLTRDEEAVAASFRKRWDNRWGGGIIGALAQGILMTGQEWPAAERLAVCRFYVETVNANIREFLSSRPSVSVALEDAKGDFSAFLERIGAEGDLPAAMQEWEIRHNAS